MTVWPQLRQHQGQGRTPLSWSICCRLHLLLGLGKRMSASWNATYPKDIAPKFCQPVYWTRGCSLLPLCAPAASQVHGERDADTARVTAARVPWRLARLQDTLAHLVTKIGAEITCKRWRHTLLHASTTARVVEKIAEGGGHRRF